MPSEQGVQKCQVDGCNTALAELLPNSNPKAAELYCPTCHLSYSKYSPHFAKRLPHVFKKMFASK